MPEGCKLPVRDEAREAIGLQLIVGLQVVEDPAVEDKEAPVDPVGQRRLLLDPRDGAIVADLHVPELRPSTDHSEGGDLPVALVEVQ